MLRFILYLISILLLSFDIAAEERLRLATTTSTQNSGLMNILNPVFEKQHNVKVDVIAVGTGRALRLGKNGDVDAVLVHAPGAERKFVEAGYGIERLPVMHNDFVLLGPENDPAGLSAVNDANHAMALLVEKQIDFISRGDDSGTHKKEISLWKSAELKPEGAWYISAGQGMGAVLTIANEKFAYTLTDRGTYLAYQNKIDLRIVYEDDAQLSNPYHIILVNPELHPHVKTELASAYAAFLQSDQGQSLIANYRVTGQQLFDPDVKK